MVFYNNSDKRKKIIYQIVVFFFLITMTKINKTTNESGHRDALDVFKVLCSSYALWIQLSVNTIPAQIVAPMFDNLAATWCNNDFCLFVSLFTLKCTLFP